MTAKKKGKRGAIIGAIIYGICGTIGFMSSGAYQYAIIVGLFSAGLGAIYGFGMAFGWQLGKKWLAKISGVTVTTSFLAILFSRDRATASIFVIPLMLAVLCFSFGIAYIPGIFIGIRTIREENQALESK